MLRRILTATAAVALLALSGAPAWSQVKDIRWATSSATSSGYKALVVLANLLNKEMPKYQITVLPTPGAVVTIKGYATGQYEGFYGSDVAFVEFAANTGRFKDFRASVKREPMQSFWGFTLEPAMAVKASEASKYKSWSDLNGKKVFTGPLPFDTRNQLERALAALGIKHNYVQVDLETVGSQLDSGAIDAMCLYTAAETTPPPWLTQASLATDWAVLNPSAEEIATLKAKNFTFTEVKPAAYKKDIHADKVVALPFFYGFHVGADVPADDVYAMLKIIEANAAELAKTDSSYGQIAADFVGMQKRGLASSIDLVPVHPGFAKYLREKGAWDSKWDAKIGTM
jgi:TRAP transporter TAXI family solute receptor